jgi:hypothetical protein
MWKQNGEYLWACNHLSKHVTETKVLQTYTNSCLSIVVPAVQEDQR